MKGLKYDYFKGYNTKLDRMMNPRPDLILLNEKIIIEVYGDKWHANNQKYNDDEIIKKWSGAITAKEIREFDLIRKQHLESFGFKVLEIWASEVYNGEYKEKIYNYFYKTGIVSNN